MACFRAIYVNGIDLTNPVNVDNIVKGLGLDVDEANAYQQQHDWQQWADINQVELTKLNLWGVPCFSYRESAFGGKIVFHALEKEIKLFQSVVKYNYQ